MIKFDVMNRFSGKAQFSTEIDCTDDAPRSIKLGLAVKWAIKAGAYLAGANLADAYLANANLAGANLADANLAGANLAGAYLAGANLADANLADANLAGANLANAYLANANLADANLADANLAGANLADAYLANAYLAGARDIIALGYPNGWTAWSYRSGDGVQRIRVGCRDKTLPEARSYWAGKENRREVMAAIDYAEAMARLRGWHG